MLVEKCDHSFHICIAQSDPSVNRFRFLRSVLVGAAYCPKADDLFKTLENVAIST